MNDVTLIGNLGRDPELRSTQSGTAVCNFSLATREGYKDKNGEWVDHTEWHNVVVWGSKAESAAAFLTKGAKIAVRGKLQTREWEDKEGNRKFTTEVVAREIEYLVKANPAPRVEAAAIPANSIPPKAEPFPFSDDDIPF